MANQERTSNMSDFKGRLCCNSAEKSPAAKLPEQPPMFFLCGHYPTSFRTVSIAAKRVFISESSVPMEASETPVSD
jgi:hypothetical protein